MATQSLRDLYLEELREIHDAEQQILQMLPTMIEAASSPALARVFEDQVEQTRVQVERLQLIFTQLGEQPTGRHSTGMDGLIKEGRERLDRLHSGDVKDAVLIGAAQKVEHYEISAYGTTRAWAQQLGAWDHADLLQQSAEEAGETDHRLTGLAESGINQAARQYAKPLSEDAARWGRLRYVEASDLPRRELDFSGITLRDPAGADLGSLDGFVVEHASGRPLYYVADSGGWFIGRRYLVPIGKGRFDQASRTITIDLDRERLQRYPEFNANAYLSMTDEQARAYERRLLTSISPEVQREPRFWESYDRLPEYAAPSWLTASSWGVPPEEGELKRGREAVDVSGRPPTRERESEMIRGQEEMPPEAAPEREEIRGVGEEPEPRRDRRPRE